MCSKIYTIPFISDPSKTNKLSSFFHTKKKYPDIPVIKLEFGTNQQNHQNGIREGADVYFECNIKSNPWVYKVSWKHNVSKLICNCIKCQMFINKNASLGQGHFAYVRRWNDNFESKLTDIECKANANGSIYLHCCERRG